MLPHSTTPMRKRESELGLPVSYVISFSMHGRSLADAMQPRMAATLLWSFACSSCYLLTVCRSSALSTLLIAEVLPFSVAAPSEPTDAA